MKFVDQLEQMRQTLHEDAPPAPPPPPPPPPRFEDVIDQAYTAAVDQHGLTMRRLERFGARMRENDAAVLGEMRRISQDQRAAAIEMAMELDKIAWRIGVVPQRQHQARDLPPVQPKPRVPFIGDISRAIMGTPEGEV